MDFAETIQRHRHSCDILDRCIRVSVIEIIQRNLHRLKPFVAALQDMFKVK